MNLRATLSIAVLTLNGCAISISDDSPSITVDSKASYQDAYRRADAFARTCHSEGNPLAGSFIVSGNLYSDNQTGVVRIQHSSFGKDLMRTEIAATPTGSRSVIRVAGAGMWDERELQAISGAIRTGTITCR